MQSSPPKDKESALRTMQIVAGAMIMGVLAFGAIATFMVVGAGGEAQESLSVAPVAAGISLLLLVVSAIVPANLSVQRSSSTAAGAPGQSDAQTLLFYEAYQKRMIVRFALVEGAAFLNLAAALIDKQPYSLALAGLMAAVMILGFPTRGRVESFIKSQTELADLPHGREGH
jgi:hypothetical protein